MRASILFYNKGACFKVTNIEWMPNGGVRYFSEREQLTYARAAHIIFHFNEFIHMPTNSLALHLIKFYAWVISSGVGAASVAGDLFNMRAVKIHKNTAAVLISIP